MRAVYLVSCVSKKQAKPCKAKELYQSDWFRKARAYIEAKGSPWYILSANYGLLDPEEEAAPYEKTLNRMPIRERREWAKRVSDNLGHILSKEDQVIILAGNRYREFLMDRLVQLASTVSVPMEGMRIGKQLSWLGKANEQAS